MDPTNSPKNEGETPSVNELTPPTIPPRASAEELAALLSAGNVAEFNKKRSRDFSFLEGVVVRDKVLDGIDLSYVKLSRCIFERCSFARANLDGASLSLSSMSGCSFTDAKLNWLAMSQSQLAGTSFERVSADGLRLNSCHLKDVLFVSGSAMSLVATGSTFSHTRFSSMKANLANFNQCSFQRTSILQSNLSNASFRQSEGLHMTFASSVLHQADFTDSNWRTLLNLSGAYISSGQFQKSMFDKAAWDDGFVLKSAIVDEEPPKDLIPSPSKKKSHRSRPIDGIPGTDKELYQSALERLNKLVGLEEVKREILELAALLRVSRARERHGANDEPPTLHYVFSGAPGTGKTTVARIIADLLKSLGYLKQGQCIETDRAGLVAAYTGQTAIKTHSIIEQAIGGVLFVDEAYALTPEDRLDPYGPEAIATLLKQMEDRRHEFVVIVAGYTTEMKRFLDSNPGLQSRFSQSMKFPSLSRGELELVFDSLLASGSFTTDDETRRGVGLLADRLRTSMGESFGNARTMRTIFDKMRRRQSVRITANGMPDQKEEFFKLTFADIPSQEMIDLSPEKLRAEINKKGIFIAAPGAQSKLGGAGSTGPFHLN